MSARVLVIALACASLGCASDPEARPPKVEQPVAVSDGAACATFCGKLEACGGAPANCVDQCESDRARLRDGVMGSFVTCVAEKLTGDACPASGADRKARASLVSICYGAVVEAYAASDHGAALDVVLASLCRRRARCGTTNVDEHACVAELAAHQNGAASKLLAVARPERVASIAKCVEGVACEVASPIGECGVIAQGEAPAP